LKYILEIAAHSVLGDGTLKRKSWARSHAGSYFRNILGTTRSWTRRGTLVPFSIGIKRRMLEKLGISRISSEK